MSGVAGSPSTDQQGTHLAPVYRWRRPLRTSLSPSDVADIDDFDTFDPPVSHLTIVDTWHRRRPLVTVSQSTPSTAAVAPQTTRSAASIQRYRHHKKACSTSTTAPFRPQQRQRSLNSSAITLRPLQTPRQHLPRHHIECKVTSVFSAVSHPLAPSHTLTAASSAPSPSPDVSPDVTFTRRHSRRLHHPSTDVTTRRQQTTRSRHHQTDHQKDYHNRPFRRLWHSQTDRQTHSAVTIRRQLPSPLQTAVALQTAPSRQSPPDGTITIVTTARRPLRRPLRRPSDVPIRRHLTRRPSDPLTDHHSVNTTRLTHRAFEANLTARHTVNCLHRRQELTPSSPSTADGNGNVKSGRHQSSQCHQTPVITYFDCTPAATTAPTVTHFSDVTIVTP
ncbi:hypothetical protein F5Y18DRAFT_429949 [Xylariaceae sp. FL1019]|nr:hypothetical protein F5Y18DRAFT_429949 [Xylariaceae sp. FL1019]